jgi:hypothetical protein
MPKNVKADTNLVSKCGLYCGSCNRYQNNKGKCPGCLENHKATWCKPRTCCIEHEYASCGDCEKYEDFRECNMAHGIVSRFFGVLFNSDRKANIDYIKKHGVEKYSIKMAKKGEPTIKRR